MSPLALPAHSKDCFGLVVAEGEAYESAVVTDDLFHLGGPRVVRGRLADGALAFQAVNPADGASFHFDVGHVAVFPEGKGNDDAAHIADVRYDFVPAILNGGDEACIVFAVWRGLGVESLDARLAANAAVPFHFVTGQHGQLPGLGDGVRPSGFRLGLGFNLRFRLGLRLGLNGVERLGLLRLGFGFNGWF